MRDDGRQGLVIGTEKLPKGRMSPLVMSNIAMENGYLDLLWGQGSPSQGYSWPKNAHSKSFNLLLFHSKTFWMINVVFLVDWNDSWDQPWGSKLEVF